MSSPEETDIKTEVDGSNKNPISVEEINGILSDMIPASADGKMSQDFASGSITVKSVIGKAVQSNTSGIKVLGLEATTQQGGKKSNPVIIEQMSPSLFNATSEEASSQPPKPRAVIEEMGAELSGMVATSSEDVQKAKNFSSEAISVKSVIGKKEPSKTNGIKLFELETKSEQTVQSSPVMVEQINPLLLNSTNSEAKSEQSTSSIIEQHAPAESMQEETKSKESKIEGVQLEETTGLEESNPKSLSEEKGAEESPVDEEPAAEEETPVENDPAPVEEPVSAEEPTPATEEESPVDEEPDTAEKSPIDEKPAAEEEPPVEEEPVTAEKSPIDEEPAAEEESPVEEEPATIVESPVSTQDTAPAEDSTDEGGLAAEEESPVDKEPATEEESPVDKEPATEEESPVEEQLASAEDAATAEESPVEEQPAAEEESTVDEEPAAEEESPVEEVSAAEKESPVEEEPAAEEESPGKEEPAAEEESPVDEKPTPAEQSIVEEETVAENELPVEEETVVEKESPVEEDAEKESPVEEEAAAAVESPVEEEPAEKSPVEEEPAVGEESPVEEQTAAAEEPVLLEEPAAVTEPENTEEPAAEEGSPDEPKSSIDKIKDEDVAEHEIQNIDIPPPVQPVQVAPPGGISYAAALLTKTETPEIKEVKQFIIPPAQIKSAVPVKKKEEEKKDSDEEDTAQAPVREIVEEEKEDTFPEPTAEADAVSIEKEKEEESEPEEEEVILGQWEDLMGEDLQMKILSSSHGAGRIACQPQDSVLISFVGRLAPSREDEDGEIFQKAEDWWVSIGDKQVHPALEMGIRFLATGQTGLIWSHSKFAFGPAEREQKGLAKVPPDANVSYEVTVKRIATSEELATNDFQIALAKSRKMIGNDVFTNEKSVYGQQRALALYQKTANGMISLYNDSKHNEEAKNIILDCLNNIVAVYLRSKEYKKAKEAAVEVLLYDDSNFKALLRAAKAAMLDPASSYEEADAAIEAAEKVDANNRDLKKLRAELKQKKKEHKQKTKEMMERMQKGMTTKTKNDTKKEEGMQENADTTQKKSSKKKKKRGNTEKAQHKNVPQIVDSGDEVQGKALQMEKEDVSEQNPLLLAAVLVALIAVGAVVVFAK